MSDLTVIYYTANKISDHFAAHTMRHLLTSIGDLPLITVSQMPMTFGENICVIGSSRDSNMVAPKIRAVNTRNTCSNIFDT